MPKVLICYVQYIDSLSTWLGKILKFGIFVLIGILLFEAVARYIFNAPTPWAVEMSEFTLGTYFLIGGGYALLRGAHVRMDALYNRWSARRKAIVDLATFSLIAVYLIVLVVGGSMIAAQALISGQHASTQWGPPLAPIKTIVVVGAVLLLLQAVAFFIRDLAIIRGKPMQ